MNKIYPDSGVELSPFTIKHYDRIMNIASLGFYRGFIRKAMRDMNIQPDDTILDLGCGTGRNARLMSGYLSEKGSITGIDLSDEMGVQFKSKFNGKQQVSFLAQRIDQPFDLGRQFDIVFISFVFHGFPHEVRPVVIKNIYNHLKPGGAFMLLDFAEFHLDSIPALHRFIFKSIECKYAFDYVERDWKQIFGEAGFTDFQESHYVKKYVRLLKAIKP